MNAFWKTIGYILGGVWLAPISLCGVIVALLCGARGEVSRGAWFVFAGGFVEGIMVRLRIAGFTWGQVVILRAAYYYDRPIREHELRHVLQGLFCGVLFPVLYAVAGLWTMLKERSISAWYWYNPFEVDARKTAWEATHPSAPTFPQAGQGVA